MISKKKLRMMKRLLSLLLVFTMCTPNIAPLVAFGAEYVNQLPRRVDFSRPEPLLLEELGLATDSNASEEQIGKEPETEDSNRQTPDPQPTATASNALREPEFFYDDLPAEPDGILVQYTDKGRTYLMEENVGTDASGNPINSYVTVVGQSSTIFKDRDGLIKEYDNTLIQAGEEEEQPEVATASSARKLRRSRAVSEFTNANGQIEIRIPEEMSRGRGYVMSNGEDTIEVIPTEGNFGDSVIAGNAIRYSNVFKNVDFQYTVIGDSIKEDIILLEPQNRYEFSYKLKSDTLNFKQVGDSIAAYRSSVNDPVFRITAPVMIDDAGSTCINVGLKLDSFTNTLTFIADKDWLKDEERTYPVRIDPGAELVGYDAFTIVMVAKGDRKELSGTGEVDETIQNTYFGDNGHTMVGYSKEFGFCRALIAIDTAWETLINHPSTEDNGTGIKNVQFSVGLLTNDAPQRTPFTLRVPTTEWNPANITWARMENLGVARDSRPTGGVSYSNGYNSRLEFDITNTYYGWVNHPEDTPRCGLLMEVESESGIYDPNDTSTVYWAETLHNKNAGKNGPRLEVAWEGTLDPDALITMPMSDFTLKVGPGLVETEAGGVETMGILAHGASQAGSTVEYTLYEKNGHEMISGVVTAYDTVDCPDYSIVDPGCMPDKYRDSNWQSDPVITGEDLELNTIYYVKGQGTGFVIGEDPETGEMAPTEEEDISEEKTSDEFLLYQVQATDLISRIARHYGVTIQQIQQDNQLTDQLTVAGSVLFIRNPQTDEPYTEPLNPDKMEELLKYWLLQGIDPRCASAMEPVNLSTGSFYMTQSDSEIEDFGGNFGIERSYNSIAPYFRSEFGMGWNSLAGEKIMVLEDGTIIYIRKDGKGITFERTGSKTYSAPDGYDYNLKAVDYIDTMGDISHKPEGEKITNGQPIETATPSSASMKAVASAPVPSSAGWEITQPDGKVKQFNAYGLLVSESDKRGYAVHYIYDNDYLLTGILSPSGKEFKITQTEKGIITDITLPDGNKIQYEYDEDDNLISVTNPEGGVRRYEYDDAHHMIAWYDENGSRIVANSYDEKGRVTVQEDALGNLAAFEYLDGLTILTDNNGNEVKYYQDAQGRNVKIEYADGNAVQTVYSQNNRIAAVIDELGAKIQYTYDENGNILTQTRADGAVTSYTYNELNLPLTMTDYAGNTWVFTYDERGNMLSMTDPLGNCVQNEYDALSRMIKQIDANGNQTVYQYDGPVITALRDGEGNEYTFTYDSMYRLLTRTDPLGHRESLTYDKLGRKIKETAKDGGVTVYEFSPAGTVLAMTDPMGARTTFTYDAMYNIVSGKDSQGNTLTYGYDGNYNKTKEIDAKGNTTSYLYDSRDRLESMTDVYGNRMAYVYDATGKTVAVTNKLGNTTTTEYDPVLGLPVAVTDALGYTTTYTYDILGQLIRITYADGSYNLYEYDANQRVISTVNQLGLITRLDYDGNGNILRIVDEDASGETREYTFVYDGNNRLIKTVDPLGGVKTNEYDAAGNLLRLTDERNHSASYTYDPAGRLEEMKDALGNVIFNKYDKNGNLLAATDAKGNTTNYYYDLLGQLLAVEDAKGNLTALTYDSLGNATEVVDALKGTTRYEYDSLSRTAKTTDALGHEYLYEYDANGNITKLIMPDGDTVTMLYNEVNQLVSYTDEAGLVTEYEYDSMGRVVKASDNAGNIMTYEYDAAGNLVKQTDVIGREATYVYDQFGRLTSVTGTDQATTVYAYDKLDRLVSVTTADGQVISYRYDKAGNLVGMTEPGEAVYTYAYDEINRLTRKVNPLGAATSFQYDANGNLTHVVDGEGASTSYEYDVLNLLTSQTDGNGNSTVYEYDELSRLLSVTTPEGNKQEYRYDALSNLVKVRDANGLVTEYRYDVMGNLVQNISPLGAVTAYTYDKHDELTSVTDALGGVTTYKVDLNRQVTELIKANGGQYQYSYDEVHRLTGMKTPLGYEQQFLYDDADNIRTTVDNLGRKETFEYDIMHRMTQSVNAKGGVETYGYDVRGNQNQVTNALGYTYSFQYDVLDQLTVSIDPEGKATKVLYDKVGNIKSITNPGDRTTTYTYDKNYNLTGITDPKGFLYENIYDMDNRQMGTVDPLGQTQSVTYDAGSRVTSMTDKMGLVQEFTYDAHGNVVTAKATNGLNTHFTYDLLNRLTSVTDPMNNVTSYSYDVMGNLVAMTNAQKNVTKYTYDLEGNMTSVTSPMGRVEQFHYDAAGRLGSRVTAKGDTIRYNYDKLNGLAEKSYLNKEGSQAEHPVQMGYNVMGQRISMEDITGESTYTYDSLGRLKSAVNGSGKEVIYTYDEANNLSGIQYPDGKQVTYEYDKNDNITKLTDRDKRETMFEYDALNRLTKVVRADGSESTYAYNAKDQIVEAENRCVCGFLISNYKYTYDDAGLIVREVAKECLFASDKDYGHEGGEKEECAHVPSNPWYNQNPEWQTTDRSFTYDNNGQLLECRESKGMFDKTTYTYEYDEVGNRTKAKKQKAFTFQQPDCVVYTYNADNQMTETTVTEGNLTKKYTFTYDANGNMLKECYRNCAEISYQYDTENRLTAVYDRQKLLMAASYDGDGNRIFQLNYNPEAECGYGKNVSGEVFIPENSTDEDGNLTAEGELFGYICSATGRSYDLTEYVNDTNRTYTEVLGAYTVNSGASESYSYAGDMRISRNDIWTVSRDCVADEMSYYLYDGRGSVTANTWYNGMVTNVYQYDPYGQVTLGGASHRDFYGYNGESYNPNTGLEYLRARYYNAEKGRFFQEDSYLGDVTEPLTLNRYAYVVNSPLNYVDPSGHEAIDAVNDPTSLEEQRKFIDVVRNAYGVANPSNATTSTQDAIRELMQQAVEESGIRTVCDLTDDSINGFFEVINWEQVLAGLGITLAGAGIALISGAMLVGVAPLALLSLTTLVAGIGIMDALIVLGTALCFLIGTIFGLSDVLEGVQTTYHGIKNDGKAALNIVRDTLFRENSEDYYFIEFMTTIGGAEGLKSIKQFGIDARIVNNYMGLTTNNVAAIEGVSGAETTRVGRWMSQAEYDKMIETGKVQMSGDNKVHVANPADINAFGKQAPKGSIYVEFDVPSNTISAGGTDGWGIINGPGSLIDRLNAKKGLPRITEMPDATNIEIKGSK